MAKIWPCYEGNKAHGGPWKEISIKECTVLFDLLPTDYYCDPADFAKSGDNESTLLGYQKVVVEVDADEATLVAGGWKPGIYSIRMTPAAVHKKLGL